MVGAEGYKCEACKGGLREATKQLQLFSYPQVLLLGLKRFETRGGSKGGNRAAAETYSSRKVGVDKMEGWRRRAACVKRLGGRD
jgi:ubiquitin C-terminal hydrolase